jgi:hypothetical protein
MKRKESRHSAILVARSTVEALPEVPRGRLLTVFNIAANQPRIEDETIVNLPWNASGTSSQTKVEVSLGD